MSLSKSTTHEPAVLAVPGTRFRPTENWRCQCGREHGFGAYATAHWAEALDHTCDCGRSRTFKAGRVLSLKTKPSKKVQCPDGGTCHHHCEDRCFRVEGCAPLSGVYENDEWPEQVQINPAPIPVTGENAA